MRFGNLRRRFVDDRGLSLMEVMVTIGILGIITTLALTIVRGGSSNAKAVRQTSDLNEESRLVFNRISRELREASGIVAAVNPDATNSDGTDRLCPASPPCFNANGDVSVTFDVNFNGNESIEPEAADPERLTYKYERAERRLLLQTSTESTPILAANVNSFKLTYRSSEWRCDSNYDGRVTWQELESAPSPPCPANAGFLAPGGSALDGELRYVDRVVIEMTVLTPPREQQYRTHIDLRNRT